MDIHSPSFAGRLSSIMGAVSAQIWGADASIIPHPANARLNSQATPEGIEPGKGF
jgi:hypothetical protein